MYFEGRFRGTGVGVILNDSVNDYSVEVDGTVVVTLRPGRVTHWVGNLRDGVHRVHLVKRRESPGSAGEFGGFAAAPGGALPARPPARRRSCDARMQGRHWPRWR